MDLRLLVEKNQFRIHIPLKKCFVPKSQVPSPKSQVPSPKAKRLKRGFTLIEMMVVIGIIAILAMWAIPGVKKVYNDFKMRGTIDKIDMLASAMRSCYLVFNETIQIDGGGYGYVDLRMLPFVAGGGKRSVVDNRYGNVYVRMYFPEMELPLLDYWYAVGDFYFWIGLRKDKPLGYDEFLRKLAKKGYITQEKVTGGSNYLHVYLPERKKYTSGEISPYTKWFQ